MTLTPELADGAENGGTATKSPRSGAPRAGTLVLVCAAVALAVGGTALGLAVSDTGGTSNPPRAVTCAGSPKLTVQGLGQSTAAPDVLTAVMEVDTTAGTATASLTQNNTEVAAVVFQLTQGGVAHRDIQTTGLSLQPQYAFPRGVPTITGYHVVNTVTATLHDITTAGTVVDGIVAAAGNTLQIDSLTFSFNNPSKVEDQARAAAVHQAVSHARTMALAAGRHLGPVCSLTDQTQSQTQPIPFGALAGGAAAGSVPAAPAVPIEAGTQSESDQVTLIYALN
jgi:uncharacterized protein YggE